jgi:hypothetical protein
MFVHCHVLKLESKEPCWYLLKSFVIIEHFLKKKMDQKEIANKAEKKWEI